MCRRTPRHFCSHTQKKKWAISSSLRLYPFTQSSPGIQLLPYPFSGDAWLHLLRWQSKKGTGWDFLSCWSSVALNCCQEKAIWISHVWSSGYLVSSKGLRDLSWLARLLGRREHHAVGSRSKRIAATPSWNKSRWAAAGHYVGWRRRDPYLKRQCKVMSDVTVKWWGCQDRAQKMLQL